jgi:hypothetical protein
MHRTTEEYLQHTLFLLAFQRLAQRERASCTEANIERSIGTPRPKLCRNPPPIRPDSQPSPLDFASIVSWNFTIPRRRFGSAGPYAEGESCKSEVCLHCRVRQSTLLCLLLSAHTSTPSQKPKSTTIQELFSHLRVSRSASVSLSFVQSNFKIPTASDLHLSPSS